MNDLSTRIRDIEAVESERRLDQTCPVVVRLDGVSFSTLTRSMTRPFDGRLSDAMIATTRELVARHGAVIGFTQSDEITLVWDVPSEGSVMSYGARTTKLASVLAGLASSVLTLHLSETMPGHAAMFPHFDARAFSVPDREEGANAVLARFFDAKRNAVSMAAHAAFRHGTLAGVSTEERRRMLAAAGIDFDAYPEAFRQGSFVRRRRFLRTFTPEELAAMPPKARTDGAVMRSEVAVVPLPCPFDRIANRVEFLFEGAEPVPGRYRVESHSVAAVV